MFAWSHLRTTLTYAARILLKIKKQVRFYLFGLMLNHICLAEKAEGGFFDI